MNNYDTFVKHLILKRDLFLKSRGYILKDYNSFGDIWERPDELENTKKFISQFTGLKEEENKGLADYYPLYLITSDSTKENTNFYLPLQSNLNKYDFLINMLKYHQNNGLKSIWCLLIYCAPKSNFLSIDSVPEKDSNYNLYLKAVGEYIAYIFGESFDINTPSQEKISISINYKRDPKIKALISEFFFQDISFNFLFSRVVSSSYKQNLNQSFYMTNLDFYLPGIGHKFGENLIQITPKITNTKVNISQYPIALPKTNYHETFSDFIKKFILIISSNYFNNGFCFLPAIRKYESESFWKNFTSEEILYSLRISEYNSKFLHENELKYILLFFPTDETIFINHSIFSTYSEKINNKTINKSPVYNHNSNLNIQYQFLEKELIFNIQKLIFPANLYKILDTSLESDKLNKQPYNESNIKNTNKIKEFKQSLNQVTGSKKILVDELDENYVEDLNNVFDENFDEMLDVYNIDNEQKKLEIIGYKQNPIIEFNQNEAKINQYSKELKQNKQPSKIKNIQSNINTIKLRQQNLQEDLNKVAVFKRLDFENSELYDNLKQSLNKIAELQSKISDPNLIPQKVFLELKPKILFLNEICAYYNQTAHEIDNICYTNKYSEEKKHELSLNILDNFKFTIDKLFASINQPDIKELFRDLNIETDIDFENIISNLFKSKTDTLLKFQQFTSDQSKTSYFFSRLVTECIFESDKKDLDNFNKNDILMFDAEEESVNKMEIDDFFDKTDNIFKSKLFNIYALKFSLNSNSDQELIDSIDTFISRYKNKNDVFFTPIMMYIKQTIDEEINIKPSNENEVGETVKINAETKKDLQPLVKFIAKSFKNFNGSNIFFSNLECMLFFMFYTNKNYFENIDIKDYKFEFVKLLKSVSPFFTNSEEVIKIISSGVFQQIISNKHLISIEQIMYFPELILSDDAKLRQKLKYFQNISVDEFKDCFPYITDKNLVKNMLKYNEEVSFMQCKKRIENYQNSYVRIYGINFLLRVLNEDIFITLFLNQFNFDKKQNKTALDRVKFTYDNGVLFLTSINQNFTYDQIVVVTIIFFTMFTYSKVVDNYSKFNVYAEILKDNINKQQININSFITNCNYYTLEPYFDFLLVSFKFYLRSYQKTKFSEIIQNFNNKINIDKYINIYSKLNISNVEYSIPSDQLIQLNDYRFYKKDIAILFNSWDSVEVQYKKKDNMEIFLREIGKYSNESVKDFVQDIKLLMKNSKINDNHTDNILAITGLTFSYFDFDKSKIIDIIKIIKMFTSHISQIVNQELGYTIFNLHYVLTKEKKTHIINKLHSEISSDEFNQNTQTKIKYSKFFYYIEKSITKEDYTQLDISKFNDIKKSILKANDPLLYDVKFSELKEFFEYIYSSNPQVQIESNTQDITRRIDNLENKLEVSNKKIQDLLEFIQENKLESKIDPRIQVIIDDYYSKLEINKKDINEDQNIVNFNPDLTQLKDQLAEYNEIDNLDNIKQEIEKIDQLEANELDKIFYQNYPVLKIKENQLNIDKQETYLDVEKKFLAMVVSNQINPENYTQNMFDFIICSIFKFRKLFSTEEIMQNFSKIITSYSTFFKNFEITEDSYTLNHLVDNILNIEKNQNYILNKILNIEKFINDNKKFFDKININENLLLLEENLNTKKVNNLINDVSQLSIEIQNQNNPDIIINQINNSNDKIDQLNNNLYNQIKDENFIKKGNKYIFLQKHIDKSRAEFIQNLKKIMNFDKYSKQTIEDAVYEYKSYFISYPYFNNEQKDYVSNLISKFESTLIGIYTTFKKKTIDQVNFKNQIDFFIDELDYDIQKYYTNLSDNKNDMTLNENNIILSKINFDNISKELKTEISNKVNNKIKEAKQDLILQYNIDKELNAENFGILAYGENKQIFLNNNVKNLIKKILLIFISLDEKKNTHQNILRIQRLFKKFNTFCQNLANNLEIKEEYENYLRELLMELQKIHTHSEKGDKFYKINMIDVTNIKKLIQEYKIQFKLNKQSNKRIKLEKIITSNSSKLSKEITQIKSKISVLKKQFLKYLNRNVKLAAINSSLTPNETQVYNRELSLTKYNRKKIILSKNINNYILNPNRTYEFITLSNVHIELENLTNTPAKVYLFLDDDTIFEEYVIFPFSKLYKHLKQVEQKKNFKIKSYYTIINVLFYL